MAANETAVPSVISGGYTLRLRQLRQCTVMEQKLVRLERTNVTPAVKFLSLVKGTARYKPYAGGIQLLYRRNAGLSQRNRAKQCDSDLQRTIHIIPSYLEKESNKHPIQASTLNLDSFHFT
jgi:hypothetical protein